MLNGTTHKATATATIGTETDEEISREEKAQGLWISWTLLVLLRAAMMKKDERLDQVPEKVRFLFKDVVGRVFRCGYINYNRTPEELPEVEAELAGIRRQIEEAGGGRLGKVCREAGLNAEETEIIAVLYAFKMSPMVLDVCRAIDLNDLTKQTLTVGQLMRCLTPELKLENHLRWRRIFHPCGRLLKSKIVNVSDVDFSAAQEPDIMAAEVEIRSRVLNRIIGDDISYAELSAHLDISVPETPIESVILPQGMKNMLLQTAEAWRRRLLGGESADCLAYLFHGPSGTGKTMMAEALAAHLGIPLVRMKSPYEGGGRRGIRFRPMHWDTDDVIEFVLREAHAAGGIAFFDECDDIFANDTSVSRKLLLEMDHSKGMVVMATNNPARLDPALDRRFSLRIHFDYPMYEERRAIWEVQLAARGVAEAGPFSLELAEEYHFAGGYIVNAVRLAAMRAREGHPITLDALRMACEEQKFHFRADESAWVSSGAKDFPPLSEGCLAKLDALVEIARRCAAEGEGLKIQLSGNSSEDVRWVAGTIARKMKFGVVFLGLASGGITGSPRGKHRGSRDEKSGEVDMVRAILNSLPADCAIAFAGTRDEDDLAAFRTSELAGRICFYLKSSSREVAADHLCHLSLALEPPKGKVQEELWRAALSERGCELGEEELRSLATDFALTESEMREACHRARCNAMLAGKPVPAVDDFKEAIGKMTSRRSVALLFG